MKKSKRDLQASLFGTTSELARKPSPSTETTTPEPTDEPPPDVVERPKLRIVAPQPPEDVAVEPTDDGRFWISFVRHDGTTRGELLVTRTQLEMLLRRAPAALALGVVGEGG